MKTLIYITGKITTKIETDIPFKIFEKGDISEFYNIISNMFSSNDWNDICCEKVEYFPNYILCNVKTY